MAQKTSIERERNIEIYKKEDRQIDSERVSETENKIRTELGEREREREIGGGKRQRETYKDRETETKTNLERENDIELDIQLDGQTNI